MSVICHVIKILLHDTSRSWGLNIIKPEEFYLNSIIICLLL